MLQSISARNAIRRLGLFLILAAGLFLQAPPAPAYFPIKTAGGVVVGWRAGSPLTIWDDTTKTMTWQFYNGGFPQGNWPTVAQAGAAMQNAYQSYQEILGTNVHFNRAPDTNVAPVSRDGRQVIAFVQNQNADFFGTNLVNAYGITYIDYDQTTGVMQQANIFINGDPAGVGGTWSTTGAPGTNDVQATLTHEGTHSLGAGHTPYFLARVFPFHKTPTVALQDRCVSPDDRAYAREVYPGAALQGGTLTGSVTLSGGGAVDRAVVVATDLNGVPQAITATDAGGNYALNVPAGGSPYTVSAFNGFNSVYAPTGSFDLDFVNPTPATAFINATTVGGLAVADGVSTNVTTAISCTAGTPTLQLGIQSVSPAPPDLQGLFVSPGTTPTVILRVMPVLVTADITSVDFGLGITVTGFSAASPGPAGTTDITANLTVAAGATPGMRNTTIALSATPERLFLPGILKVVGTGGITISAAAGNPVTGNATFGAMDQPLLRVALQSTAATASNLEDVRIRNLVFTIAGSGPMLPAVRLWIDVGTPGVVDGADTRVFSGAAYANNPISETITVTPPGTVTFDNLALPVPAGGTVNLLLTADLPAAGAASYTASLAAADVSADGMYWGDPITVTGGPVTGGTIDLSTLSIAGLTQIHTSVPRNVIPVGGTTNELQIDLVGTVTASSGTVGMDVEAQPLGTAFTGTPTVSLPNTSPNGSTLTATVPAISGTSYHWQARATGTISPPSAWVSFGGNPETAIDFSCDTSTTAVPTGLAQFDNVGAPMPLGGSTKASASMSGVNGANSQGHPVQLQVEVQPAGVAFTNSPTVVSAFVPSGTLSTAVFTGPTSDYHWQARSSDQFGAVSAWVAFDPAAIHFHLTALQEIKAKAGCAGSIAAAPGPLGVIGWALGLSALALLVPRRRLRSSASALLFLGAMAAGASADGIAAADRPLPRSMSEEVTGEGVRGLEPVPPDAPPAPEPWRAAASKESWITLDAYLGMLFMDMKFDAIGTDFVRRTVKGIGTGIVGIEAMIHLLPDWRVGLMAEGDLWADIEILGGGVVGSWRFAKSQTKDASGHPEQEYFIRVAGFYENLKITKSNFGSFNSTIGVRAGFEFRNSISDRWAITVGADLQYSVWNYAPTVQSGDTKIGGFGGAVLVGLAFNP